MYEAEKRMNYRYNAVNCCVTRAYGCIWMAYVNLNWCGSFYKEEINLFE